MFFKCPHCNDEIETDDRIDIDVDDTFVECKVVGHCPTCDRNYQWVEVYKHLKTYGFTLTDQREPGQPTGQPGNRTTERKELIK